MIRDLVAETKRALFAAAEAAGDQASAGLAVGRIEVAEKNVWMLRSHLEDRGEPARFGSSRGA